MTAFPIPDWNAAGLLPPVDPRAPTRLARSPYRMALTELVLRFAHSPERRAVLEGFFAYRAALHAAGLIQGFVWLNGSFLEHMNSWSNARPTTWTW